MCRMDEWMDGWIMANDNFIIILGGGENCCDLENWREEVVKIII